MKTLEMITNGDESNYIISDGKVSNDMLQRMAELIEKSGGDIIGIDNDEGVEFYWNSLNLPSLSKGMKEQFEIYLEDNTL